MTVLHSSGIISTPMNEPIFSACILRYTSTYRCPSHYGRPDKMNINITGRKEVTK